MTTTILLMTSLSLLSDTSGLQQFAKELVCRSLVAMTLHQNIEDLTVGIDGPPEVILLAFDREHDLIEMPLISRLGATAANLIGICLSKLFAPLADGFIRYLDTPIEHHFLDISVAQRKRVIEPNTVTNNLNRKTMVFVTDAHGLALIDADKGNERDR